MIEIMVEIGFYSLSFLAVSMLLLLFKNYSFPQKAAWLYGGFALWLGYLMILDRAKILQDFGLPPRIPILVVIPIISLVIFFINRRSIRKALTTPLYVPIALQSFRIIVELLIYATFLKGIFPEKATFDGLNFDILVGFSAIFISWGVVKGIITPRGILIWNIAGLLVLTLTVYSFISSFYVDGFISADSPFRFVQFPYLLLASVLLPIAVGLHAFSIKQVLIRKREPSQ